MTTKKLRVKMCKPVKCEFKAGDIISNGRCYTHIEKVNEEGFLQTKEHYRGYSSDVSSYDIINVRAYRDCVKIGEVI